MIPRGHLDEHADKVLLLRMRRITDDPARALKLYSSDGRTLSLPQLHAALSTLNVGLTQLEAQELIRRYPSAQHLARSQQRFGLGRTGARSRAQTADRPALHLDIAAFITANGGSSDSGMAAPSRFLAFSSDSLVITSAGLMPDRVPRGAACRKISPQRAADSPLSAALAGRLISEGGVLVSSVADAALDAHSHRAIASAGAHRGALDAVGGPVKWAADTSPSFVSPHAAEPWRWSPASSPQPATSPLMQALSHSDADSGGDGSAAAAASTAASAAGALARVPPLPLPLHAHTHEPISPHRAAASQMQQLSLDDIAGADDSRWAEDDMIAIGARAAEAEAEAEGPHAALPTDTFGALPSSRRGGSNPVLLRTVAANGGHVPAAVAAGIASPHPNEPLGGALNASHSHAAALLSMSSHAGEGGSSTSASYSSSASPDPYASSRWRSRLAAESAAANATLLPSGSASTGGARAVSQAMLAGSGVAERLAAHWTAATTHAAAVAGESSESSPAPARLAGSSRLRLSSASAAGGLTAASASAPSFTTAGAAAVAAATAVAAAKQEAAAAAAAERVRSALRSALPPSARHASTVLSAALGRSDSDRDGLVRDTDVFFRLRGLCPDLQAGDVALALHAARAHVAPVLLQGVEPSGLAIGGGTTDRDVALRDFVGWVVEGGEGAAPLPSPAGAGGSFAEAHMRRLNLAASATSASAASTPAGQRHAASSSSSLSLSSASTGRDAWLASPTSFEAFKANWVVRHGEAGRRELEADAKREMPGPTWSAAGQTAFKVLHLKERPPLPLPLPLPSPSPSPRTVAAPRLPGSSPGRFRELVHAVCKPADR